ncbi:TetR/AcrR family transcriptional regulator C-terminal domain-containing protein [Streptomyces actinomycinicus]|uniref:TetR/AcrR family transcriptional regulator C-terminal domain-containing protein n=1 Tax=Streptomyces actinomycinicus TaxID=1695166 RepID=A0A937EHB8_9ACTN|nr:TetR/AcrR family transcriptional regulator C-terminal domain-containing protein [Streptomyces actinomycinicus]MBL1082397.1 TetR/AcrR family transcriptional regulator C-terminal domain-containing protein [Streptomyces actinomycinicus]
MKAGSAGWWKARYAALARQRPRAGGLELGRITEVALRIVDGEGLAALTMRRVAEEMGVRHTSLYRHVASRDELLVELVDHVLGEVRPAESGKGWRADAEQSAWDFRRVLLGHPAIVPLLTAGQLLGPNALRARETGLGLLISAGWKPSQAVQIYLTVTHFVIGTALLGTGGAARGAGERTAMTDLFAGLPQYPLVRELAVPLNLPDGDQEFRFGLTALLDGIGDPR